MSNLIWPLLMLLIGLALLVAEVFLPTGGVIGIVASALLVVSLVMAFMQSTMTGMSFLLAEAVLVPAAFALGLHLLPRTPMAKRAFLRPPDATDLDVSHESPRLDHLIGQFGRALTPLRPSGMVDFDGRRLDGVAEDGLIPSGALVMAVQARSGRLIVRFAPEELLEPTSAVET
jgi:membrane-bound ClpP family serine protease